MSKKSNSFSPKSTNVLSAWCRGTVASIRPCGLQSNQLPQDWLSPANLEWVGKQEIDTGLRAGITSEERDPIKALEREVQELRRANKILKLASAFFAQAELDRKFKF